MNMDDDIDLTMRAPYIPMSGGDDLPLLLSEDLMWGAFPEGLSLHKDIKAINHLNQSNKIDSSLAALLCGSTTVVQQQQHQQQQSNQQSQQQHHHHHQEHIHHHQTHHNHHHSQQQQHITHQHDCKKNILIDHGGGDLVNPNEVMGNVFSKNCKFFLV